VVFGRDAASGAAAIHADLGGQPVSLIRRPSDWRTRAPLTALSALLAAAGRSVMRGQQRSTEVTP
jgi:hypothetical protein